MSVLPESSLDALQSPTTPSNQKRPPVPYVIKWQTSQQFDELIDFAAHPVLHSIFLSDLDNLEEFFIIKNPSSLEPKVNYLNNHHLEQILDQIPGVLSVSPVAKGRMFKHPNALQLITQSPSITITAMHQKSHSTWNLSPNLLKVAHSTQLCKS